MAAALFEPFEPKRILFFRSVGGRSLRAVRLCVLGWCSSKRLLLSVFMEGGGVDELVCYAEVVGLVHALVSSLI